MADYAMRDFVEISCNWRIANNKQFKDTITTQNSLQAPEKTDFEDLVSFNTGISLQPMQSNNEACMLDIKLMNDQRISRIAIVSEACVLEFFKDYGEYETTVFAECVDEFKDNYVYFAETTITPSTTEAGIKFTKTKNKASVMWIYGIRLYLVDEVDMNAITYMEMIKDVLGKLNADYVESPVPNNATSRRKDTSVSAEREQPRVEDADDNKNNDVCEQVDKNNGKEATSESNKDAITNYSNITLYIDNKFHDLETRLLKRIEEMEQRTSQKLDEILERLYIL